MKHFAFMRDPLAREHDFKLKVQNSIVKVSEICFLMRRLNMQWRNRQGQSEYFLHHKTE